MSGKRKKGPIRLIISGGRDYSPGWDEWLILNGIFKEYDISEVLSGACPTGVDPFGEYWAKTYASIPVKQYPADWNNLSIGPVLVRMDKNGKKYNALAGPNRNEKMAQNADAVVLFCGNRGTASMRRLAKKYKLKILYDFIEIKC